MMGPTHVAIGTATALGLCALLTPPLPESAVLVGTALGCSKMPDQLEVFGLRHRGPTHWLLVALLVVTALGFVASMIEPVREYGGAVWIGAAIGYLMHIAADMCTVSGVEVLAPFSRRDHWLLPRGMRIVTGKGADSSVAFLATVCSMGLVWLMVTHA